MDQRIAVAIAVKEDSTLGPDARLAISTVNCILPRRRRKPSDSSPGERLLRRIEKVNTTPRPLVGQNLEDKILVAHHWTAVRCETHASGTEVRTVSIEHRLGGKSFGHEIPR